MTRTGGSTAVTRTAVSEWSLRSRVLATLGAVVLLHALALGMLGAGALESSVPLSIGLVITCYLTGVKHSYDWDHIAAIDNSTRRFISQGKRPASVGLAFSLGHSSVVILAGVLVVLGATFVSSFIEEGTTANTALGIIGGTVSGVFLLVLGTYNATASVRSWRLRRAVADGQRITEEDMRSQGLIARVLDRPLQRVKSPRNIYVLGFLFGLGFDTASTVSLLIITASASVAGVSTWTLISLPFFFAAGMCLCDSLNGLAVLRMYGSTWRDPVRKLGFNAVITGISAVSALFIAFITVGAVLNTAFDLNDPLTTFLASVDLGHAGLLLIAGLLAVWGIFALVHRSSWRASPALH
ncbi:HoxN/HupN/NixA family nickel/cobalt transporter [Kocuria marina]|uniref:HoxN/HupN/NixA family nickel/cobalt transporter n=1 Tax=Kocuria marina TaxID=223184 RepID=UPI0011A6709C